MAFVSASGYNLQHEMPAKPHFITLMSHTSMKPSWAQPSLSRDFALLAAAIIALLLLLSAWVAWTTYTAHSARIITEMEKEASRVDSTLEREIDAAGYLLNAIGHQIIYIDRSDMPAIGRLLRAFDARKPMYEVWSWANPQQEVVVSSNKGVLDKPVSVADRDYIHKAQANPWIAQIGAPIEGRVSGRWVIPVSIGVTDNTGKYLGTLIASIDINALTQQIAYLVKREGIGFAIMSRNFEPLTVMSDNDAFMQEHFPADAMKTINITDKPKAVISKTRLIGSSKSYSYYQVSERYPYVILVGYENKYSDNQIHNQLLPRLVQIVALACFLLLFLWIVRVRIIKPVVKLAAATGAMARGLPFVPPATIGPQEMVVLTSQIGHVYEYIQERKKLEEELRGKIEALLQERKS